MSDPIESPDRESGESPSRNPTARHATAHVVPWSVPGRADEASAMADTDRAAKTHHNLETTLPSARNRVAHADLSAHVPVEGRAEPSSLPRAPWTLVIARRSYALARAAGKLVADHQALALGIAMGTGVLVGRALAPTGPKRLTVQIVTLFARVVGRSLAKAARATR